LYERNSGGDGMINGRIERITVNTTPAVGFLGLTFLILLVLKLTKLATISWFWVFSPLLVVPAILLLIGIVIGGVFAVAATHDYINKRKRLKRRKQKQ